MIPDVGHLWQHHLAVHWKVGQVHWAGGLGKEVKFVSNTVNFIGNKVIFFSNKVKKIGQVAWAMKKHEFGYIHHCFFYSKITLVLAAL